MLKTTVWPHLLTTSYTALSSCGNHFTEHHCVLTSAELTTFLVVITGSVCNRVVLGCVVIILHKSLERVVCHLDIVLLLLRVKVELLISLI
jgi:hypothetical protein